MTKRNEKLEPYWDKSTGVGAVNWVEEAVGPSPIGMLATGNPTGVIGCGNEMEWLPLIC